MNMRNYTGQGRGNYVVYLQLKKQVPTRSSLRLSAPTHSNRETLQRLSPFVHHSNDAVIIRDSRDQIIAWNKGAERMYGYSEIEALGMKIQRLIPEKDRMRVRELSLESSPLKKALPTEIRRRAKDGRVLDVLLSTTVLYDGKGTPLEIATTERDITEHKKGERQLRRLHAQVVSAQERERKRLARELHDGVGQILSGIKFRLETLPGEISLTKEGKLRISEVGGLLDRAIAETRRVSQNLIPSELDDLGLESALKNLCREFKGRNRLEMQVRLSRIPRVIPTELGLAFFRIAQESFNNIGKHSKATIVNVTVSRENDELLISVSDNGIGFRPDAGRTSGQGGIGLGNMRERVAAIGGSIRIRSAPGEGTTLDVRAPLTIPEEEQP